ncbi:methionine gamma-lyase-like protein [Tanacetum coccineum]
MADTIHNNNNNVVISSSKKRMTPDDPNHEDDFIAKKLPPTKLPSWEDPVSALANARHEFGEHGGVNMSIEASATFTVMEPETLSRMFAGELGPDRDFFIYSRHFNPTVLNLGRQMAALEGTEAAYCTASGMSAISSVLLTLVSSGDNIVASQTLYGGTHALLTHFLPRSSNIQTTFVDIRDLEKVKEAIVEGRTKVLYFESMSNPTLTVANIPELSRIAHEKGVTVVVDNTFAPMVVSPARLGADVVVHSISKYISGGADIIAGAVCGPASLVNSLMDLHQGALMLLGPTMNAKVAFELSERIPHLGLRVKEHCHRALVYAQRMKKMGLKVIYPGLEDHPDHLLLKSIANKEYGFGGMLCLDMGTEARANKLMNLLQNYTQFGLMAVSLGYYETLMSCSGSSTSSELNEEEQALAGISPGLVRMSVGYSGTVEQRWGQFEKALSKLQDLGLLSKKKHNGTQNFMAVVAEYGMEEWWSTGRFFCLAVKVPIYVVDVLEYVAANVLKANSQACSPRVGQALLHQLVTSREYTNYLLSAEDRYKGRGYERGREAEQKQVEIMKDRRDKVQEEYHAARDSNDALVCYVENTVEDRIMDSGASFHATYCKEELERFKLRSGKVRLADDKTLDIAGFGDVVLKTSFGTSWTLKDVRWFGEAEESFLHNVSKDKEIAETAVGVAVESTGIRAEAPKMLWADSVSTTYLIYRIPHVPIGLRIPDEEWQGKDTSLTHLKVFGCDSFVKVKDVCGEAMKCKFIGRGSDEVRYSFRDTKSHQVIRSRDITFVDSIYGAKSAINSSSLTKPI